MKYTLFFEITDSYKISLASSNSLLKLCKIRKMTFKNGNVRSCIVETKDADDDFAFRYDEGYLFDYELADFNRFRQKVDDGYYYKSYDYSHRVRERYLDVL